ncbi:hypothetical protein [Marivita sp. S2033]|uniref:hypothetical protein n=1 Tax=Marivita sp. S2033 TaxID=3373187 RepID=UPI003982C617
MFEASNKRADTHYNNRQSGVTLAKGTTGTLPQLSLYPRRKCQEENMAKPDDDEKKKKPPKKPQDDLHRPEETLGDAPASDPNPTERSRIAD